MSINHSLSNLRKNNSNHDKTLDDFNSKEQILCNHCKRTASNGIRCMGICVADSDY